MDGKLHSAKSLAYENEVSTKTITRAIETLLLAGVSVESKLGKSGGYFLPSTFMPQIMSLNEKDLSNILTVANQTKEILRTSDSRIEETIINTAPKNKLKDILCMSSKIVLDSNPWLSANLDKSKLDTIYNACINLKEIEFDYINYKSELSHRIINPYCITLKNGTWYTYGLCKITNKAKLFKLTRMSNISQTKNTFKEPDIDIKNKPWNNFESATQTEITVKIKSHSMPEIQEWLNIKNIKESNNEIIATAIVKENDTLYNKLIEESNKIQLLSPSHMVHSLLSKCEQIQKLYKLNA